MKRLKHVWKKFYRWLPWCVCANCGLVGLKNEATNKALCTTEDD